MKDTVYVSFCSLSWMLLYFKFRFATITYSVESEKIASTQCRACFVRIDDVTKMCHGRGFLDDGQFSFPSTQCPIFVARAAMALPGSQGLRAMATASHFR
jgi:hypothetical protein